MSHFDGIASSKRPERLLKKPAMIAIAVLVAFAAWAGFRQWRLSAERQLRRDQINAYNLGKELAIVSYDLQLERPAAAKEAVRFIQEREREPMRRLSEMNVAFDIQSADLSVTDGGVLPSGAKALRLILRDSKDQSVANAFFIGFHLQELLTFNSQRGEMDRFINEYLTDDAQLALPSFKYPTVHASVDETAALSSALHDYQQGIEGNRFPTE